MISSIDEKKTSSREMKQMSKSSSNQLDVSLKVRPTQNASNISDSFLLNTGKTSEASSAGSSYSAINESTELLENIVYPAFNAFTLDENLCYQVESQKNKMLPIGHNERLSNGNTSTEQKSKFKNEESVSLGKFSGSSSDSYLQDLGTCNLNEEEHIKNVCVENSFQNSIFTDTCDAEESSSLPVYTESNIFSNMACYDNALLQSQESALPYGLPSCHAKFVNFTSVQPSFTWKHKSYSTDNNPRLFAKPGQTLPVPTVLEKFPGFVRCVVDIAPEVVGWVIGRSGAHIKEMKHRSGCGMWVDQKDLKLYITGTDMPRIHIAAGMVADLISKAPVNVSAAGVEDEVVSQMIDCPPHLIGLLIGRGGSTIKRIKEESRANVVINQKMMKVIVSGIPQSVHLAVGMIDDVFTFGKAADEQHHETAAFSSGQYLFPLQGTAQDYMEYGSDIIDYGLRSGHSCANKFPGENIRNRSSSLSGCIYKQATSYGRGIIGTYGLDTAANLHSSTHLYNNMQQNDFESVRSKVIQDPREPYGFQHIYDGTNIPTSHVPNPFAKPWIPQAAEKSPNLRPRKKATDWSMFSSSLFNSDQGEAFTRERSCESDQDSYLFRVSGIVSSKVPHTSGPISQESDISEGKSNDCLVVEEYLEALSPGLGVYATKFHEHEIDVNVMKIMDASDFMDIGIPKGPALRIFHFMTEGRDVFHMNNQITSRQFLSSLGLSKYAKQFEEENIDILAMSQMKEQDFADFGVAKGSRLKIMAELETMMANFNIDETQTQTLVQTPPPSQPTQKKEFSPCDDRCSDDD